MKGRIEEIDKIGENQQNKNEQLIHTIVTGSDWEEVLTSIVVEQNLDPENLNIIELAEAFLVYLKRLESFDFRIPARFILIAAILLNMKCEALLEKEEERLSKLESEEIKHINLESPLLIPPTERNSTRPVSLTELISALNKAMEIKSKKEREYKLPTRKDPIEIVEPIDIEKKINNIYEKIRAKGIISFSDLVPVWRRKEIIEIFLPLMYLASRGSIICEQHEMFKEIIIKLK